MSAPAAGARAPLAALARTPLVALARLDGAELLRARWLWVCLAVYGALTAVFVGVGLRESHVLGFTGLGRVVFSLSHALVYVLPLLALVVTGLAVTRAREDGSLELLMSLPVTRTHHLSALLAVRVAALVLPLLALLLGLGAAGAVSGGAVPWGFLAQAGAVCAALLWGFAALGLAISCWARTSTRALALLLTAWLAAVALLDFGVIGLLLRWQLAPQAVLVLACLNPVEAARVALLASGEPDLATLGPVGFYLAERLGPAGLVALGVGWPLAFGAGGFAAALWRHRRDDLV
jgi:ABC-type transport system involved in multi-copper enzyme maturation permease subunit